MIRVLLKNLTNNKYNFYLFIDSSMRKLYNSYIEKSQNILNNKSNIIFFNNNNDLQLQFKKYKIDIIILSLDFSNWLPCITEFPRNKIYYITHGIVPFFYDAQWYNCVKNWTNKQIKLLVFCKTHYSLLKKHDPNNVYKIGTIPQIENLIMTKNIKESSILIVGGRSKLNQQNRGTNLIINILQSCNNLFSNMQIYVKPLEQNISFHNLSKNINILNDNLPMYDYFNSEIIIIIDGGTSYLEALLANAKVILYIPNFTKQDIQTLKLNNVHQWYIEELYQFQKFPSDQFPNLLVAHDFPTLIKHINTIKTIPNYFETEDYSRDKNQYIKDSIGEYVPNISKQLINIIEKNELTNSHQ